MDKKSKFLPILSYILTVLFIVLDVITYVKTGKLEWYDIVLTVILVVCSIAEIVTAKKKN